MSNLKYSACTMHYQRIRRLGSTDLAPRSPRVCSFEGCHRKHYAKGYCHSHWKQINRGESLRVLYGSALPLDERLELSIEKTATCWLWTRSLDENGYASITVDGRAWKAHRYMYTRMVAPIPEGMEIDHMCFVTQCVNPDHLRLVSRKQNIEHKKGAQKNNKLGVLGVHKRPSGRFSAEVKHNHKTYHLGTFSTIEEADAAARAKRASLFTHDDAMY